MDEYECGCRYCDNRAQVDPVELFPKYVVGTSDGFAKSFVVCRDCFEIAYRNAPEDKRVWRPTAQSVVLA